MPLCWTASLRDICFVHLGKFGDIMIMLPAFKAIAEETGKPAICLVSEEFASIFDGVTYVQPWVEPFHWWKDVGKARELAERAGLNPIVVKWWDEPGAPAPAIRPGEKTVSLNIHGLRRVVSATDWDSFQASQWRYSGFSMDKLYEWPLVFDKRSPEREQALRDYYFSSPNPKLLVNLSANGTSPFRHAKNVMSLIWGMGFDVVDLSRVRAHRIYDLLGLYDEAAGLITSDTATLHLAAASSVPYIAFINNGGAGSIPKGNCIKSIRYSQFEGGMGLFVEALKKLKALGTKAAA